MKKSVSALLCALLCVSLLTGCGNKVRSFENNVKNNKYQAAISTYEEDILGDKELEDECEAFLEDYLSENMQSYQAGKLSDDELSVILETLEEINDSLSLLADLYSAERTFNELSQSHANYDNAVSCMESGNYADAISLFALVNSEDSLNYQDALEQQQKATELYVEQIISSATESRDAGDYELANTIVREAMAVVGDNEELSAFLSETIQQAYETKLSEYAQSGDSASFFAMYEQALTAAEYTPSAEITELYSSYKTAYVEKALAEAETAFSNNKDYESAISVLTAAAAESGLSDFDSAIAEYQEYVPVSLSELEYTQKADYLRVKEGYQSEDVQENEHSGVIIYSYSGGGILVSDYASGEDESYVSYNLNRKYSTMTGTVYRPLTTLSCTTQWNQPGKVKIYGDSVLLYESADITQEVYDPIDFSIDVSGVRELKIVVLGVWRESDGFDYDTNPKVCLGDVILQK